ncbi:hypothetical protein [Paenirhodobacter populi]|uniref:Uncharacterized protein n=1 Tax=Paenirhodobacter populi TaxID=2306993 RepID=A0A443IJ96_9RHOB|nr:hypothetical protein [Sinirhodobacter populi]RWR04484.1 hypothetical protein D2T33_21015 [Sinirhodobacter populi]
MATTTTTTVALPAKAQVTILAEAGLLTVFNTGANLALLAPVKIADASCYFGQVAIQPGERAQLSIRDGYRIEAVAPEATSLEVQRHVLDLN